MAAPGAFKNDVQRIVKFIEHQPAEPDEREKHCPSDGLQGAYPMQFLYNMFSQRREKALEKTEEDLLPDHILTHHETQAVEQEEDEREEGEQGEKSKRGRQTGAPMAQK